MKTNSNIEQLLSVCKKEIIEKTGWGNPDNWTYYNFNHLSQDISDTTGINISISSVRRLMGKDKHYKENYTPQFETRNALVRYLGYKNWYEFSKHYTSQKLSFSNLPTIMIAKTMVIMLLLIITAPFFLEHYHAIHPAIFLLSGIIIGAVIAVKISLAAVHEVIKKLSVSLLRLFF